MDVKLRMFGKGKRVRTANYHVFINSKSRNAGYTWKVRMMGKVKWM